MREMNSKSGDKKKMRVLRIAHSSLTPALRQRERALVRSHEDVDLKLITTESWREAEMEVAAVEDDLFPVKTAPRYFSKHLQLFAYDPRPIIKALREYRPHLVDLSHEPYSVACAEVLTLCSWFAPEIPIVMQTNQNILHNYPPPFNWLEHRAFRKVAAAYACSETVCEVLRAKGFDKPAPIIPFGVDIDAFRPAQEVKARSGDVPTIGFVGRMLPGKGLNVLAEALGKLRGKSWRLLLIGDGPECEGFNKRLAEFGVLDRVQATGAISFELIPPYFHEMDLLVIPTETTQRIREQFGRVIVEAMASGVPVIGSTCGAIPEVIGEAGLVFQEGDAKALASAIRRLISDKQLRQHLAGMGRIRVEQHYSWEQVAHLTYELFNQVLRKRREPGSSPTIKLAGQTTAVRQTSV